MLYGYVRVSTKGQNISRQLEELKKLNVADNNIYIDKATGANFERDGYLSLIDHLKENDTLIIKSIDRLGRDYQMIINEWKKITKEIKAKIYVIDMPLLDTRNDELLITRFIADIVLQILSFVAENEREYIKSRQKEGIEIAKCKGVKFGRPKLIIDDEKNVINDFINKKIDLEYIVNNLNISKSTFYRRIKEHLS